MKRERLRLWRRLVEELKIGDLVEVIKLDVKDTGKVTKITRIDANYTYAPIQLEDRSWWRTSSLRKLTPEEIQHHLAGEKGISCDRTVVLSCDLMDVRKRLSAIEKRLKEERNLMTEIEERLDERIEALDMGHMEHENEVRAQFIAMKKRLDFMEAYQKGEMPEVCECPMGNQMPNGEPIRIVIMHEKNVYSWTDTCPGECLEWTKKVLDSMREG